MGVQDKRIGEVARSRCVGSRAEDHAHSQTETDRGRQKHKGRENTRNKKAMVNYGKKKREPFCRNDTG